MEKEYIKKFDEWNSEKKIIESKAVKTLFQEREIWWCSVGENIGFEEGGKHKHFSRPVLILKKYNSDLFLGVELTSQIKRNKFHFELSQHSFIILSQVRTFSSKRLFRRMIKVTPDTFEKIQKRLANLNFRQ